MSKTTIPATLLALVLMGCATTPTQSDVQSAVTAIQITIPVAVEYAVMKDPRAATYCNAAAAVIDTVAGSGDTSPDALLTALAGIDPALETPEAKLAVMAGVGIYSAYFAKQVQSDANTVLVLRTVALAIRQGLTPGGSTLTVPRHTTPRVRRVL